MKYLNENTPAYKELADLGATLRQLYEDDCNLPSQQSRSTKITELELKAEQICKELGVTLFLQTDPRGASIYIGDDKINDSNYSMYQVVHSSMITNGTKGTAVAAQDTPF